MNKTTYTEHRVGNRGDRSYTCDSPGCVFGTRNQPTMMEHLNNVHDNPRAAASDDFELAEMRLMVAEALEKARAEGVQHGIELGLRWARDRTVERYNDWSHNVDARLATGAVVAQIQAALDAGEVTG